MAMELWLWSYGYGVMAAKKKGLWIVRSGAAWDGSLDRQGVYARYWSGTVNSSDNAYYLHLNSTDIIPAGSSNRASGRSVRCLAR